MSNPNIPYDPIQGVPQNLGEWKDYIDRKYGITTPPALSPPGSAGTTSASEAERFMQSLKGQGLSLDEIIQKARQDGVDVNSVLRE